MTSAYDITSSVNPPRAAFLDYPLGHTTGKPDDPVLQRAVMLEALEAFASLREPGQIKRLPFAWDEDGSWKVDGERKDDRQERFDTPQYQCEDDRLSAERMVLEGCAVCGLHG